MKSSRKRKVTAAFFAAAALGGVAHAAPTLNMNDLVGSNTTTESTTQATTNVGAPVVRPVVTQPTPPITQTTVVTQQQAPVRPTQVQQTVPMQTQPVMQAQTVRQQTVTTQALPKVTPLIPRVRPVPVTDTAKALSQQHMAVSQPQYVVNKQTNTVMEPTLAMHSLMNVQRKTEPVTVQKQVDGKQQIQTTQVQRTPVVVQEQSTMPLTVANTTTTKPVVAKQKLTIRDIQRAERERIAQLEAEEAAKQSGVVQVDQQMAAQKQAEAQRQAAILGEQQRQMALQAEQQRIAQQQAEAQRQAAILAEQQRQMALQAEQQRIAQQQAEAQRQTAILAEQQRLAAEQAEAQRQAALRAEQERIAAQQAEQARIAEAQRQAAEQERLRIQEEQRRIALQQAEQQRLAAEQAEAQRQAALKAEQERIAAQQAEQQRIAAEQAEAQRQAALKAEQERIAAQQAEQQRIAAEQAEAQRQAALKAEQERIAAQQAEQQRIAAEQAEAQRQAVLKAEQERIAAEQAEAQRQAALKAEQERIAALQAEQQRIAAEQAEAQRQAALKAERERILAQQAEEERLAAEEAARQRAEAAAKAEAERQAALKAEQERIAAEQAKAEREAAIKAEQERIAAEQAEIARQAAIKEEQERLAAEQLAKEEAEAAAKAQAEAEAKAKAEAEAKAKAQAEAEAAAKAQAEAEAKAKAEAEAAAKAQAEAEEKAKVEANVQESKLPQSYVDARNEASTKGSAVVEEKDILSQPMEPPLQADASSKISLAFDVKNYESMSTTVDNKEIKYRAFEYIPYVANPIDIDQQYMNIYVPEEYFNNGTVNGYNTQTAPIFMPNAVGGYMPSQAMTPKVENGKPNSVVYALSRGYVVASPATRGRTNKASDGNFIGKAPAVIVDLQAATAYLHANDSTMPGNANRIITNGTSAGGAVSLLQGAAGNSSDFQPYLQALGAATAATNVYAVSAYAPITNLDAADMAYEWSYNGITSSNKVSMSHDDVAYSNLLNEHFPDYVNNLQLHDSVGRVLKLDKNGNGTFKNYVKEFIIAAANKAQAKGTDLSKHTYLVRDNKTGTIKDINWEAYNRFVSRSKAPGAFDSRSNDSGENNLFGTSTTDNNHFTITAALHDTTSNPEAYVQNAKVVTMMNPMNYLGSPAATNAQFYRIRYGTADSNTSVAIPLIVGTRAQNLGYKVDMATPFDVNHSGDYDLDELFNWIDNIVKNGR
ncbi:subtype B tannase [Veillonella sp. S13053-19]|uniref:subtype B tannase n=1 Tax=Veillonella sp. S13053-19 TaxID=2027456 RepID=UPI0018EAB88B|nr:subtype B tannase [Veillonella sp. S13053-19]